MKTIFHPVFQTLYVDDLKGVYWQETKQVNNQPCILSLLIEETNQVTARTVELAAAIVLDLAELDCLAKQALGKNQFEQTDSACFTFWKTFCAPHLASSSAHNSPTRPQVCLLRQETFTNRLQLSIAYILPAETENPLILEYTLPAVSDRAALHVFFNGEGEVFDIQLYF